MCEKAIKTQSSRRPSTNLISTNVCHIGGTSQVDYSKKENKSWFEGKNLLAPHCLQQHIVSFSVGASTLLVYPKVSKIYCQYCT